MDNIQYQFQPLDDVHPVRVHWKLSRNDYQKLHTASDKVRNHWNFLLERDLFHIYKGVGGIEHYRFVLHRQANGGYLVDKIETHDNSDFYNTAQLKNWTRAEINEHKATFTTGAIQEVVSILEDLLDIHVDTSH